MLSDNVTDDNITKSTLQQIESLCELDDRYDSPINLVYRLLDLSRKAQSYSFTVNSFFGEWEQALAVLKDFYAGNHIKAATVYHGNPVGGQMKPFPIPAFLIQAPHPSHEDKYTVIRILYLMKLRELQTSKGWISFANELRIRGLDSKDKVLSGLPSLKEDGKDYIQELRNILNDLPGVDASKKDISLVKKLRKLLPKEVKQFQTDRKEKGSGKRLEVIRVADNDDDDKASVINFGDILDLTEETGVESDEPNYTQIWRQIISGEGEELPSEVLEAGVIESSFWLRRHQNLSKYNTTSLTLLERKHLINSISELLENKKTFCVGYLIGLLYFLPLKLDEVFDISISDIGFNVISRKGIYFKKILVPHDAYKPGEKIIPLLDMKADVIELELPELLRKNLFPVKDTGKLLSILNIRKTEAIEDIRNTLQKLRENGKYRIDQRRLECALSLELSVSYENTLLTYLISGRENHKSPMLSYYGSLKTNVIKDTYSSVTKKLAGEI